MKNLIRISLVLIALLAIATSVNAMTTNDFVSYVSSSKTIAGKSVVLVSASQKRQIEGYLAKNKVSESDLTYLKGQFDSAVKIMNEAKVTDYSKLSTADKEKMRNIIDTASKKTGIKYTVNSTGEIEIYNLDGTLYTKTPIGSSTVIKATGSDNYIYLIPGAAIVAVAIAVISKRRLANAK